MRDIMETVSFVFHKIMYHQAHQIDIQIWIVFENKEAEIGSQILRRVILTGTFTLYTSNLLVSYEGYSYSF